MSQNNGDVAIVFPPGYPKIRDTQVWRLVAKSLPPGLIVAAGFSFRGAHLSHQSMHRPEAAEHPFVSQAKQLAREAGSTDNATINWALKMLEDSLAFGNTKR